MVKSFEVSDDAGRNEADNIPKVWDDTKKCHENPNQ
jgi:hypothetical protein